MCMCRYKTNLTHTVQIWERKQTFLNRLFHCLQQTTDIRVEAIHFQWRLTQRLHGVQTLCGSHSSLKILTRQYMTVQLDFFQSNSIPYSNQNYDCNVKCINTFHITLLIKLIILRYWYRCWSGKLHSVFCQTLHSWDKSSGDVNKINKCYQFATKNYASNHF